MAEVGAVSTIDPGVRSPQEVAASWVRDPDNDPPPAERPESSQTRLWARLRHGQEDPHGLGDG